MYWIFFFAALFPDETVKNRVDNQGRTFCSFLLHSAVHYSMLIEKMRPFKKVHFLQKSRRMSCFSGINHPRGIGFPFHGAGRNILKYFED